MYAGRLTLLLVAVLATLLHAGHAVCPTGFTSFADSCYIFGKEKVTWVEAHELCNAYTAGMLETRSREENSWIVKEIKSRRTGSVWLASSDIFQEGSWQWMSDMTTFGTVTNFVNDQHCLEIRDTAGYTWDDGQCQERNNVICKTRAT